MKMLVNLHRKFYIWQDDWIQVDLKNITGCQKGRIAIAQNQNPNFVLPGYLIWNDSYQVTLKRKNMDMGSASGLAKTSQYTPMRIDWRIRF